MTETTNDQFQEPSPLDIVRNVRDAYQSVLDEKEAEHDRQHAELDAKFAPIIASCLAVYYETVRNAYDEGFSTADIEKKLNEVLQK